MLLRALVAFVALPGVVALAIPAIIVANSSSASLHPTASAPVALGLCGLVWCVRDFYVIGKGTLAPWSPPRHLVTTGMYRYSRNPMYLSVPLVLLGWSGLFATLPLLVYALVVAVAFHLRVTRFEEPWLARVYGSAWSVYVQQVPRWLGVRLRHRGRDA